MKAYYEHGGITLFHGDWRECGLQKMPRFDLLLTDPPYGIGALMQGGKNTGHWNQLSGGNSWDVELPDLTGLIELSATSIIWGGNYFPLTPNRCWFAWVKTNSVPTQADMELAWTNISAPARIFNYPSGGAYVRHHPTQKPLPLMKWCLSRVPAAKTVLDPYCGSGTTLVAAKAMGLTAVGCEREESYCEITAKRLSQDVMDFTPPAEAA